MVRTSFYLAAIASIIVLASGIPARAQEEDLNHIRGEIISIETNSPPSAVVVKTADGKTARVTLPKETTFISLAKGSFADVDFGKYVGSVAVKLDQYSPIIRDSAVWLHKGFELRVIDEELRGIALGEKKWDLTPGSIMAHGWVDDQEIRVLSIKWGPSDYDETDVEIPRDAPVHKMSLGDRSLLKKKGAHIFAGVKKDASKAAAFFIVGKDGVVPRM